MTRSRKKECTIQHFSENGADYFRVGGVLDQSLTLERLGKIERPSTMDLAEVTAITSQGVEAWCAFVKTIPSTVPLHLLNVPACFAAQYEFVPNFAGNAEILTLSAQGKCASCGQEQHLVIDMLAYASGSQILERCPKCGAALAPLDMDLASLVPRRSRALSGEVAALLAKLGVYRVPARAALPLELQKLVVGNTNLLRMSGTLDERLRPQRVVDGLEGTLLIEAKELDVSPRGMRKFAEVVAYAAEHCSPIVMVHLPYNVLEQTADTLIGLPQLILHSIVAPCYCATCDEIRQLPIGGDELLVDEPNAACPRCGRTAPMVGGVLSLERVRPMIRPTPTGLLEHIGRFDELFSLAEVEAKLTSAPAVQSNTVPQRIGPYRIVRAIARGGMADVFLATRDDFSKPVALKLLRREVLAQARLSLGMFLREARLNARLNHPNIVQVFDVNEAEGNLYIVMEYLDGHALWRVMREHAKPFPAPIAIRIGQQLLRALQHAHSANDADGQPLNIVHRDVSPSNIILCPDGNVKLIDFGIAVAGKQPEVFAGNPAWMSPEQFRSVALDGRSDLFSVATVIHEMLIGHQLFQGRTVEEIAIQVIRGVIPPVPNIPSALQLVLLRAHQHDAANRYQTAAEFAEALGGVLEGKDEASEHDVRAFVAKVMGADKTAADGSPTPHKPLLSLPPSHQRTMPKPDGSAGPATPPDEAKPADGREAPTTERDPSVPPGRGLLTVVVLVALALVGLALWSTIQ